MYIHFWVKMANSAAEWGRVTVTTSRFIMIELRDASCWQSIHALVLMEMKHGVLLGHFLVTIFLFADRTSSDQVTVSLGTRDGTDILWIDVIIMVTDELSLSQVGATRCSFAICESVSLRTWHMWWLALILEGHTCSEGYFSWHSYRKFKESKGFEIVC